MHDEVIECEQAPLATKDGRQLELWAKDHLEQDASYLSQQLITYIGNKRALLGHIGSAVEYAKRRLGKRHLRVADLFSGSGVVSRFLKSHASFLVSNDIEDYAAVIARCYLRNKSTIDLEVLSELVYDFNARVETERLPVGFIEELYAPKDEALITENDRVFYTKANARRIDNYRRLIDTAPHEYRDLLLGPLLSEASIHANTAGVFKGFYKNRVTGIGQFGGTGSDSLKRILGKIELACPVLSSFECEYEVYQDDANKLVRTLRDFDLVYVDPPYNQHPYGSNYFMLNLIANYTRPRELSRVSGIPVDWRRSGYNVRAKSLPLLRDLLNSLDSRFILISFNNEGFISPEQIRSMIDPLGVVHTFEIPYNAFRGCRNFNNRSIHVTEHLFLVERS